MPIGKNSIKRVANNGYSNVKTEAPDMENSVVETSKEKKTAKTTENNTKKTSVKAAETKKPAAKKTQSAKAASEKKAATAAKKPAAKKPAAPKKSMETEPELAPVNTLAKITENTERSGDGYTNLGGEMPYYLL